MRPVSVSVSPTPQRAHVLELLLAVHQRHEVEPELEEGVHAARHGLRHEGDADRSAARSTASGGPGRRGFGSPQRAREGGDVLGVDGGAARRELAPDQVLRWRHADLYVEGRWRVSRNGRRLLTRLRPPGDAGAAAGHDGVRGDAADYTTTSLTVPPHIMRYFRRELAAPGAPEWREASWLPLVPPRAGENWSRGGSNSRPLECHPIPALRQPATQPEDARISTISRFGLHAVAGRGQVFAERRQRGPGSAGRHDNPGNGELAPEDRRTPRPPGWKGPGHGHQGRPPTRCPRRREQLPGTLLRITVAVCENGERPRLEIVRGERHSSRHEDNVSWMIYAFRGRDALRRPNTVSAGERC